MKQQIFGASALIPKGPPPTLVNGQRDFTAGNSLFTVPAGVYSISVAVVSGGKGGARSRSGDGGNLRYQNNIAVVPGQTYTIVCGSNGNPSSALGLTSGAAIGGAVAGANGTLGRAISDPGYSQGGNVGSYPVAGSWHGGGINLSSWTYTKAASSVSSGGVAGGGGGSYLNANPNLNQTYGGGGGAVRLIWGPDRAFPNKKIGNL